VRHFEEAHGLAHLFGALLDLGLKVGVEILQLLVLFQRQCFQALLFLLQILAFQRMLHRQRDVVFVPRLGDVAVNLALVDGGDGRAHVGIAGEQDAYRIRPFGPYLFEKLRAVHLRHAHVGNHQVDGILLEHLQPRRAAIGGEDAVAQRPEQPFQRTQDIGLVIHEQQRRRLCGAGRRFSGFQRFSHDLAHINT